MSAWGSPPSRSRLRRDVFASPIRRFAAFDSGSDVELDLGGPLPDNAAGNEDKKAQDGSRARDSVPPGPRRVTFYNSYDNSYESVPMSAPLFRRTRNAAKIIAGPSSTPRARSNSIPDLPAWSTAAAALQDARDKTRDDVVAGGHFFVVPNSISVDPRSNSNDAIQQVDLCFDVGTPARQPPGPVAPLVVHLSRLPGYYDDGGYHIVNEAHHAHGKYDRVDRATPRITGPAGPPAAALMVLLLASILGNLALFTWQGGLDLFTPAVVELAQLPIRQHLNAITTDITTAILPLFGPHSCGDGPPWDLAGALETKKQAMHNLCVWARDLSDQRPELGPLCHEFQTGAALATSDGSLAHLLGGGRPPAAWERDVGLDHIRALVDALGTLDVAIDDGFTADPRLRRDANLNQTAAYILAAVDEVARKWAADLVDLLRPAHTLDDALGTMAASEGYILDAFSRHCRALDPVDAALCAADLAVAQRYPNTCLVRHLEPRVAAAVRALDSAHERLGLMVHDTRLLAANGFGLGPGLSLRLLHARPARRNKQDQGWEEWEEDEDKKGGADGRPWKRRRTMWVVEDLVTWRWKMENVVGRLSKEVEAAAERQRQGGVRNGGQGKKGTADFWALFWGT